MKNIILTIAFVAPGATTIIAQDQIKDQDQDRLMLVDGDVLHIRDRDQEHIIIHLNFMVQSDYLILPNPIKVGWICLR